MPRVAKRSQETERNKDTEHLNRCLDDLAFYARNHLKIIPKEGGEPIPFRFNKAQRIVHKKISEQMREKGHVRAIVLKARQEGLSTYTAARNFRRLNFFGRTKCVVIADQSDKSGHLFGMYQTFYDNLIPEMKPKTLHSQRANLLALESGSQVKVDTAKDTTAGKSETIQLMHASEVADWDNAEETYTSMAQAVPYAGSEIILESTASGVGNFFHFTWEEAEQGNSDFIPIFLPWWIHEEYQLPVDENQRLDIIATTDDWERMALDEGIEYEGKKHPLTVEQLAWRRWCIRNNCGNNLLKFKQYYPSTAREAFVASGSCFFDIDSLERHEGVLEKKRLAPDFKVWRGNLVRTPKLAIIRSADVKGHLRIWEPPQKDHIYVIGADTSEGKMSGASTSFFEPDSEKGGRDFSCADVYDVRERRQVAQLHGRMTPEYFCSQLVWLGYLYNTAVVAIESNHRSGEKVIHDLHTVHRYPAPYYSRQINTDREGRRTSRRGWRTTPVSRPLMLDDLSEAIRELHKDGGIEINCPETIREMHTFVTDENGVPHAQDGAHDDRVIALAIAKQVAKRLRHAPTEPETYPEPEIFDAPSGAFDYGWDNLRN